MKDQTLTIWRRDIIGWSLYDFANTIYSMNIVSQYLKLYIIQDLGYDDRYFDIPFAISMFLAALLLPALGAMSDHATRKKLFVLLFTVTCCLATGLMTLVPATAIVFLLLLFVVANFFYQASQPFYNALLYSVADGSRARFISGVGVAFGYIGTIVGVIVVLPFVNGTLFVIDIPGMEGWGKQGAFIPTALLFLLFSLPLYFWVKERKAMKTRPINLLQSYREVFDGLRQTRKYKGVLRFLIADYFFEDAATTVIINIGIYCTLVIGFSDSTRSLFLIVTPAAAVVGSFIIGKVAERTSLNRLMNFIVLGWIVCLVLFALFDNIILVWIVGSLIGILLGGLWTVSRPLLAELVPKEELGRFFGLFSLSGRAAAICGPLIWTTVVYYMRPNSYLGNMTVDTLNLTNAQAEALPYKAAIMVLAVMMGIGMFLFRKVPIVAVTPVTDDVTHG